MKEVQEEMEKDGSSWICVFSLLDLLEMEQLCFG